MMNQERFNTLEKLDLTKEEALEWVDILTQREQTSSNHKIATNGIICYQNDKGEFSYHRYVDTSRINEIYGFQFSPDWMVALRDERKAYSGLLLLIERHWEAEMYDEYVQRKNWKVCTPECIEEYRTYIRDFLESKDGKTLDACGVFANTMPSILLDLFCVYWIHDNKSYVRYKNGEDVNISHDGRSARIHLFMAVKDAVVTD